MFESFFVVLFVKADSWPMSFDDSCARSDWQWRPALETTEELVGKMFDEFKKLRKN